MCQSTLNLPPTCPAPSAAARGSCGPHPAPHRATQSRPAEGREGKKQWQWAEGRGEGRERFPLGMQLFTVGSEVTDSSQQASSLKERMPHYFARTHTHLAHGGSVCVGQHSELCPIYGSQSL